MKNKGVVVALGLAAGVGAILLLSRVVGAKKGPLSIQYFLYIRSWTSLILGNIIYSPALVTHIGFRMVNPTTEGIGGVSARFYLTDGGRNELPVPLDYYLNPIQQPFTMYPGSIPVYYSFTPTMPHYLAEVKVYIGGSLVAERAQEFDVDITV